MAKFEFKEDMWALARYELREELDEEPPFSAGVLLLYCKFYYMCSPTPTPTPPTPTPQP